MPVTASGDVARLGCARLLWPMPAQSYCYDYIPLITGGMYGKYCFSSAQPKPSKW